MTQNKSKAAMRYAARLCCIYDWAVFGEMDRIPERMTKAECVETVRRLYSYIHENKDKETELLWNQVSRDCPGTGNDDIEAAEFWKLDELVRVYNMQRRELEAVDLLKRVYEKDGRDLFAISEECNVYCWTLKGWMTYQKRISWKMVKSLEALEKSGNDYTIQDAFRGMQEVFKDGPERA